MRTLKKLLFGWLWFSRLTLDLPPPPLGDGEIILEKGDMISIHHPLSLFDRVLLKIRGIKVQVY